MQAEIYRKSLNMQQIMLRDKAGGPGTSAVKAPKAEAKESDGGGGRVLLCKSCRFKITDANARTEIDGGHGHTFFNPHGLVFDIGCFCRAPGCNVFGVPTTEFTWFPGRAWRIAVCRGCRVHLGWYFSPQSGGASFFGLIVDMLLEDDEE